MEYIEIIKKKNDFYNVYGDSIYIMNYLFKYKIIDNEKVGFSVSSLSKVVKTLDKYNINYKIDEYKIFKKLGTKNNYHNILVKAIENKKLNDKVKLIEEKLLNASNDKIDKILYFLENELI